MPAVSDYQQPKQKKKTAKQHETKWKENKNNNMHTFLKSITQSIRLFMRFE